MSLIEERAKHFYSGERRFFLHGIDILDNLKTYYNMYNNENGFVNPPTFDELLQFLVKKIKVVRIKDNTEVLWQFLLPYDEFPKSTDKIFKTNLINAIYILDNPLKQKKHSSAIKCLNILKTYDNKLGEFVSNYIKSVLKKTDEEQKLIFKNGLIKMITDLEW